MAARFWNIDDMLAETIYEPQKNTIFKKIYLYMSLSEGRT